MVKIFVVLCFVFNLVSFGADNVDVTRTKQEISRLKKDLNDFYDKKEADYQKKKKELLSIQAKNEAIRKEIERLTKKNQKILNDIQKAVATKTSNIYNKMKPKVAAKVFDQMIKDGMIDEVVEILTKLKEKKVSKIIQFVDVKNASTLTDMVKNYQIQDKERR